MLLYIRVSASSRVRPATASFLGGYLAVWGLFSLLAAALQGLCERFGLLAPMTMASTSRWLSAALLVAVGLYQLSPLKNLCLRHCRNPAQWLSAHYRPGPLGALRMGLLHGAYCAGCCWLLMLLLFAGGVMNLGWIAAITLIVAAEKLLPFGKSVALTAGAVCLAWGLLLAFHAWSQAAPVAATAQANGSSPASLVRTISRPLAAS
jgi:predicted metal-binding membrane protein